MVKATNSLFFCALLFCSLLLNPIPTSSLVHLESIYSSSFPDSPARFSRRLNGSAICGNLHLADPLDACSSLRNQLEHGAAAAAARPSIALIVRGNCPFDEKVKNAQDSGFHASIVYDDQPNHNLISMMGDPEGIWIYAVFVSNAAGEILRDHAQARGSECCIVTFVDETAWTVLVISFISVLAVIFLLVMVFFSYNHWVNHQQTGPILDDKAVDTLPCITFGSVNITSRVGETCTICLEDYKHGESLKLLPCNHVFHVSCVNSWLTKWATFCPVCKHDVRTEIASSTG